MSYIPGRCLRLIGDTWTLYLPTPINKSLPLFAAEHDTGKSVKAILHKRNEMVGKNIYAVTNGLTPRKILDCFKKSVGYTGTFV